MLLADTLLSVNVKKLLTFSKFSLPLELFAALKVSMVSKLSTFEFSATLKRSMALKLSSILKLSAASNISMF